MTRLRATPYLAFIGASVLMMTGVLYAQSRPAGTIVTGVVHDATGLVLPGATVETGVTVGPTPARVDVSAADGTFTFAKVLSGIYRLRVSLRGPNPGSDVDSRDGYLGRPLRVVLQVSGMTEAVRSPRAVVSSTGQSRPLSTRMAASSEMCGLSAPIVSASATVKACWRRRSPLPWTADIRGIVGPNGCGKTTLLRPVLGC